VDEQTSAGLADKPDIIIIVAWPEDGDGDGDGEDEKESTGVVSLVVVVVVLVLVPARSVMAEGIFRWKGTTQRRCRLFLALLLAAALVRAHGFGPSSRPSRIDGASGVGKAGAGAGAGVGVDDIGFGGAGRSCVAFLLDLLAFGVGGLGGAFGTCGGDGTNGICCITWSLFSTSSFGLGIFMSTTLEEPV
jgi:hypothetical protein